MRYEASAVDLRDERDQCDACDAERKARVLVVARGDAEALLFLFTGQAKREAMEKALDAVPETTRVLMQVASCPSCGERSPEVARSRRTMHGLSWAGKALPIAIVFGVALILVAVVGMKQPVSPAMVIGVSAVVWALAVLSGVVTAIRRDHTIADRSVEWTAVRPRGETKWKKLGPQTTA
ncbi:Hypothetical protein A7982_02392 [Minicystis rosea]|nr:Hypothetical protein A7982_02392 [Minicystis rosea]